MSFTYKENHLHVEDLPLATLAKEYGTPLYVYSYAALAGQFSRFDKAFDGIDHLICYSMKANSSRAVLKTFINLGSGIDVVTGGELERALLAGCDPQKIVFSGVGKSDAEITRALEVGILQFNVESVEELRNIDRIAVTKGKRAPVALRVNPDVDPKTHAYISTGLKKAKFGISRERSLDLYTEAQTMMGLEIIGIDCHIGSQLTTVEPFAEALKRVIAMMDELESRGIPIRHLDFGGGLGITYKDETPPTPEAYAEALKTALKGRNIKLLLEPGRFLVGNSAVLLTEVIYNKERDDKKFVVVDAASNDLMRPMLYGAYHEIKPVEQKSGRETIKADIVGPICETGDFFAQDREVQKSLKGEFLALMSAGAYGYTMSSNYNSRPRPAEIMVNGKEAHVINERQTLEDIIKGEQVPEFLK